MFTRRGEAKNLRPLAEPQLADPALLEARASAAPAVIITPPPAPAVAPQLAIELAAAPPPIPADAPAETQTASAAAPATPSHSVIGQDLTIEGQAITIRCRGALEVNGQIQAELHSQKLIVGRSGKIEGTIAAESIDVWGQVSGTILGLRVTLHPSAEVEGDIHAKTLSVADGASFEGRSRKVTDPALIAPRLDPDAPPVRPAGAEPIQLPHTVQPLPPSGS